VAARTAAGGCGKSWATCGLRRGSGVESRGHAVGVLLGHLVDLGFMGLNGPAHDFSFSFFTTSKAPNKYQMHSNLKNFNTIRLYMNYFWRFLLIFSFF
jgi:hypothetical protein